MQSASRRTALREVICYYFASDFEDSKPEAAYDLTSHHAKAIRTMVLPKVVTHIGKTTWRTNWTLPDQVTNAAASRRICRWQADASTPSWSLLHGSLPPQFTSTPCSATARLLTEPSFDGSSTTYISGRLDACASLNRPCRHFAVFESPGLTAAAAVSRPRRGHGLPPHPPLY